MKKNKIIIGILVVIALLLVVFIVKKKVELARLKPAKTYPIVVKTIKAKKDNVTLTLTSLGLIQSDKDAVISTKISARILYIKPLGSRVKKGDVILKLDASSVNSKIVSSDSSLEALYSKLKAAKLSLKNMIKTHKRTKELLDVKGASIEQYQKEEDVIENIKSDIRSIESQINSSKSLKKEFKTLLSYAVIKSPVDGVVSKKFFNKGDIAIPGKPICKIASNGSGYVLIRLPQDIQPKGVIYKNKFYDIYPLNGTFNGLNEYRADVDAGFGSNSKIELKIVVYKGCSIKLPNDAILSDNDKTYLFLANKDKAVPKRVKIAASGEEGVVVEDSDIENKDIIVAKPDILLKLLSGTKIIKEQ